MANKLAIIHDGIRQPEIDVVSIPGLPEVVPEYKVKDHNRWLREVLSHQVPKARIMSFEYDFAKAGEHDSTGWKGLTKQVNRFLYALLHRREGDTEKSRPILFLCYSFGAVILKKALLTAGEETEFKSLLDSTSGILFLGCLHNETYTEFDDLCLRCAAVEMGLTKKKNSFMDSLRKSDEWEAVREIIATFRKRGSIFPIRTFFEQQQTVWEASTWTKNKQCHLCPESTKLGWDNETPIGVDVDHARLSTFPNRNDPAFFEVLMGNMTEMIDQICKPTRERASSEWTHLSSLKINDDTSNNPDLLDGMSTIESALDEEFPPANTGINIRLPCFVIAPHQENSDFVGQTDILSKLFSALSPKGVPHTQQILALCGLGGMGKTQIALKYVFQNRAKYPVVLWAHADSRTKLAESFSRFAVELGLRDAIGSHENVARQALQDWLKTAEVPWLMIFDNADGEDATDLLRDYIPPCEDRGSVLITTRDQKVANQVGAIQVTELDEESAIDLLKKSTYFNRSELSSSKIQEENLAASQLVKQIGYLPLGIRQAANLVVSDCCTFSEFLRVYNNQQFMMDSEKVSLIRNPLSEYQYSLGTVWNMNFTRLSEDPRRLINTLAFLDPDRVQVPLIANGAQRSANPDLAFVNTARKIYKCRVDIDKSSLMAFNHDLEELSMHRLVQASCYLRMKPLERQLHFRIAISLIKECWPVPPRDAVHNPGLWPDQQALLPHVQSLCRYYVESCEEGPLLIPTEEVVWDFPSLLYEAGWFCYERGILESVSALLTVAEKYCLQHRDSGGDKILADVYGGLGSLCTENNQFQGAYDNFRRQWDCLTRVFDSGALQRPSIWEVFGLGRLGNGYHGLHRYTDAEDYYRRCLTAWEKVPGDRRIFTSHLATCLWLQGRLDEAEATVLSVLKDRKDLSNFRTGLALFSLGNIQIAQAERLSLEGQATDADAKFSEAYDSHAQVLRNWKSALGIAHHKTADAYHKVGWHYHRNNEFKKAETVLKKALDVYRKNSVFFKNEIARTCYKLGCVYQDAGDLPKGTQLIEEAEQLRREIVPPEHWAPAQYEQDYDEIVQFWTR